MGIVRGSGVTGLGFDGEWGVRRSWWAGLVVWWPAGPWPSGSGGLFVFLLCFISLILFILSYFILVLVTISTNT